MVATLKKHGNSHALIINRTMMEQLGITEDTLLQITVRDRSMVIEPAQTATMSDEQFKEAADRVFKKYDNLLRRLA